MIKNKKIRFFIISFFSTLLVFMLAAGLFIAGRNSSEIGFEKQPELIEVSASQDERVNLSVLGERIDIDLSVYNRVVDFILEHDTFWPKKLRFCYYAAEYFADIVNYRP